MASFTLGGYAPEMFQNHVNLFEAPPRRGHRPAGSHRTDREGLVHGWATISLSGHAGDAGRPLRAAASHPPVHAGGTDAGGLQRTRPWADNDKFTAQIADAAREITRRAGTTANPANYAQRFLASSAR
jgi:hypothetical protein